MKEAAPASVGAIIFSTVINRGKMKSHQKFEGVAGMREIHITGDMILAGVERLREFYYGSKDEDLVEAIYLHMEIERRLKSSLQPD